MADNSAMDMWYAGRRAAVKLKGLDIFPEEKDDDDEEEEENTSDIGDDEEPAWPDPPPPSLLLGAQGSDGGISVPWPVPEEPGWQPRRRRVGLILYDGGSSTGSEDEENRAEGGKLTLRSSTLIKRCERISTSL